MNTTDATGTFYGCHDCHLKWPNESGVPEPDQSCPNCKSEEVWWLQYSGADLFYWPTWKEAPW